jgi:transposase
MKMNNIVALPNCRVSGKKSFVTEAQGTAWEEGNRFKYPNNVKQYAYACEDCSAYHLTAHQPGDQSLQSPLGKAVIDTVDDAELYRLRQTGLSAKQIAERFGISEQTVYARTHKYRLENNLVITRPARQPVTLNQVTEKKSDLQQQVEELQRKLAEMAAVELRLIESQKMKYEVVGDTITIRKKHEQITLELAELRGLMEVVS